MTYLLAFLAALVISMAMIPLMVRLAPHLGMMDVPDKRKVHATPVPRVGGIGIVIGTLIPVALWIPLDDVTQAYLFGALVLLVFGIWDDARPLNHVMKFIGQFVAVSAVVYYGGLHITHLPFLDIEIADLVGKPFTVFAVVGMINALNTSDGLDGLAGGLALLSLACIGYLSFLSNDVAVTSLVLATAGGVFGFLRYNTYPAKVFMGDTGSQFLGFTLGVLAVLLTQEVNPAISPALPLLFLGLPIFDLIVVVIRRYRRGAKWYLAHKDHVHHRLMQLGFDHHEAVVVIYVLQCLLVVSAVFLLYEPDSLIASVYFFTCMSLFLFLNVAERHGWRAHGVSGISHVARAMKQVKTHWLVTEAPSLFIAASIPLFFLFVSVTVETVPIDVGAASGLLAGIVLVYLLIGKQKESIVLQAANYATSVFMVYLCTKYLLPTNPAIKVYVAWYFVVLAASVALAVRYADDVKFSTTPMDYLVIFIVVFSGILLQMRPEKAGLGLIAVESVVLFYAYELIVARTKRPWNLQNISVMATLAVLALKALI